MKTDRIEMLSHGSLTKALFRLCLPAVAAMTINGLYNVVDAFFIGLTGDAGAIGAISVIFPLFLIVTAIGIGVSVGVSSFMARSLGAGQNEKAEKAAGASLVFSAILGAVITVLGFVFMRPMLYLLGARDVIMPYAVNYTAWILTGTVFVIANTTFSGTIRAEGNTLYSTVALLFGTVLNIILDPVFIFACHMGIEGAAVATLISYVATFVISVWYYAGRRSILKIRFHRCINRENTSEIVKIGVPAMIKQLLLAAVFCIVNALSAAYGENAVTAAGICAKVNSFVAMTLLGITQGFMPLASFNYGAGNHARVLATFKKTLLAEIAFSGISAILYLLFSKQIVSLFCGIPEVMAIGDIAMIAFAAGAIPLSVAFLTEALFFSTGKAKASMLLVLARQGLIYVPLVFLANAFTGLAGIFWASAAADVLSLPFVAWPLYAGFFRSVKAGLDSAAIS
jgi:putative MATE family efflux protein